MVLDKRTYEFCLENKLSDLQAQIFAKRIPMEKMSRDILFPSRKNLQDISELNDLKGGVDLIISHMKKGNKIVFLTDYDADGLTSNHVLYKMFKECFEYKNISSIANSRKFGNGINETILKEVFKIKDAKLVISADHGSADEVRIKKMRDAGIDVIITDHHILPETGKPVSANYFINPQHSECSFNTYISGCCVAWCLMYGVYKQLKIDNKEIDSDDKTHVLLDTVAVVGISTIGDSMNMSIPMNRYLVKVGLNRFNNYKNDLFINFGAITKNLLKVTYKDIGFSIVPKINSASRMDDVKAGLDLMNSDNVHEIESSLKKLVSLDTSRRYIQKKLTKSLLLDLSMEEIDFTVVGNVENSTGINGILSGNAGRDFYLPTVIFTNSKNKNVLAGSGRAIVPEFNMQKAFKDIQKKYDSVVINTGGHPGAAGVSIHKDRYEDFKKYFNEEAKIQFNNKIPKPLADFDIELPCQDINLETYDLIEFCGPFGIGFEEPLFKTNLFLDRVDYFGKRREHAKLVFIDKSGKRIKTTYFNMPSALNLEAGLKKDVDVIYTLSIDRFIGPAKLNLDVKTIKTI